MSVDTPEQLEGRRRVGRLVADVVVHGIPGERVLGEGQLLTIDVALELDGFHADEEHTIMVARDGAAVLTAA
jgi:methionine aminopeptidase